MAQAIPAAIGLGGSVVGGISGKKAAKKAEAERQQVLQMVMPLVQQQMAGGKQAIETGGQQIGAGAGYLNGAQTGLSDLKKFWQPLVSGDRNAIDQFLAPERRAINQGATATAQSLNRMAPRGGGRVSALAGADVARQGALNDLVFGARREGANQLAGLAGQQGQLGLGQMGVGASVLGQGLQAGNGAYSLYNTQSNRQQQASSDASGLMGGIGNSLGGFLADIFKNKGIGGSGKASQGFGYGNNPLGDVSGSIGD